jgi:hypothetical protein
MQRQSRREIAAVGASGRSAQLMLRNRKCRSTITTRISPDASTRVSRPASSAFNRSVWRLAEKGEKIFRKRAALAEVEKRLSPAATAAFPVGNAWRALQQRHPHQSNHAHAM